jgi:hypothetical protein
MERPFSTASKTNVDLLMEWNHTATGADRAYR